ncbi:MAG: V-type ATPase 116kDa subunit family protein, partial [Candidatus Helarchaeota archaeon]
MLKTERMSRILITVHQRRLLTLIKAIGELGALHIIRKETIFFKATHLHDEIIANIEIIQQLQRQIGKIVNYPIELEEGTLIEKWNVQGITIAEIVGNIRSEIGIIHEKIVDFEEQIGELNRQLMILIKTQELWNDLLKLNIDFSRLKELKNIVLVRIGYIRSKDLGFFRSALDKYPHLFYERILDKEYSIFLISSLQKYYDGIRKIEQEFHVDIIEDIYEIRQDKYHVKVTQQEKIHRQMDILNQELSSYLRENYSLVMAYHEILNNMTIILKTESLLDYTPHFVEIEGWAPVSKLNEIIKYCNEATENSETPPPSKFKDNKIIQPFETITRLYGLPNYKEINPTLIIFITFPLIFGFMFGDIGHGLCLLIGSGFFLYWKRNEAGTWKKLSKILVICATSSIIVGFLYGDFFGQHEMFGVPLNPLL